MSVKPENIAHFYSARHGYARLVRRSVGHYEWVNPQTRVITTYWHGQLVHEWQGSTDAGEQWSLHKGQVIWLDSKIFHRIPAADYLEYTNT